MWRFFTLCRLPETVEMLQTLDYVGEESQNLIGKTWYNTCCLDLILEIGRKS